MFIFTYLFGMVYILVTMENYYSKSTAEIWMYMLLWPVAVITLLWKALVKH